MGKSPVRTGNKKYRAIIRKVWEDGDKLDCMIDVVCDSSGMAEAAFVGAAKKINDTYGGTHKIVNARRVY